MNELQLYLKTFYSKRAPGIGILVFPRQSFSDKIKETEKLLDKLTLSEQYRENLYDAILSILECDEFEKSDSKYVEAFLSFASDIKDLKINELTIFYKGIKPVSGYVDGKFSFYNADPLIESVRKIFVDFENTYGPIYKSIHNDSEKGKRGPKKKNHISRLKRHVPEINQVLLRIGISDQKDRNDFIGSLLVIAGILQSTPPKKYKTMTAYFHSRVKQYLKPEKELN